MERLSEVPTKCRSRPIAVVSKAAHGRLCDLLTPERERREYPCLSVRSRLRFRLIGLRARCFALFNPFEFMLRGSKTLSGFVCRLPLHAITGSRAKERRTGLCRRDALPRYGQLIAVSNNSGQVNRLGKIHFEVSCFRSIRSGFVQNPPCSLAASTPTHAHRRL
jgi:hypothetical protein